MPRSPIQPDLLLLLKRMSITSRIVEKQRLAAGLAEPAGGPAPAPLPAVAVIEVVESGEQAAQGRVSVAEAEVAAPAGAAAIEELEPVDLPAASLGAAEAEPQVVEVGEVLGQEPPAGTEPAPAAHGGEAAGAELGRIEEVPDEPEDMRALLAGARASAPPEPEDVPSIPAEADVSLHVDGGSYGGSEFRGKSTLAGATGVYCLVEDFGLPIGTRVRLRLTAPGSAGGIDIDDATVVRVRKALGNQTEVQLAFERPRADFEEFIGQHFGDKPLGFSLFGRRKFRR